MARSNAKDSEDMGWFLERVFLLAPTDYIITAVRSFVWGRSGAGLGPVSLDWGAGKWAHRG